MYGRGGQEENGSHVGEQFWVSYALILTLKGICPEFQVIRGFSQKIPADLLSYDQIHS